MRSTWASCARCWNSRGRSIRNPNSSSNREAQASYDLAAKVLQLIKASGVTKFGFVGNERYRTFGKAG